MLVSSGTDWLRKQNRALVLTTLRSLVGASHTEIAEWSGLSSSTVSSITAELEKEGVLIKAEQPSRTGRGRPRVLLQQNPSCAHLVTVRITATKVEFSLVDYTGTLKDRFEIVRPVMEADAAVFARRFVEGFVKLIERSELTPNNIQSVSITTKGLVAPGRPVLLWSAIFQDQQINFDELLPAWSGRIYLTNETRFAAQAVAEKRRRRPKQSDILTSLFPHQPDTVRQVATLSLDHSIGLGIAREEAGGRITSFAPHFGHMVHLPDGPLCRCGVKGCIEAVGGFYGILRTAFEVPAGTIPANFVPVEEIAKIADMARSGNRMAAYAFRLAGEAFGVGISRLHSLLGVMPLTITGPGVQFFDLMRESFEIQLSNSLQMRLGESVEISLEEDEAGLIFQGNIHSSLTDMDINIIAARQLMK